MPYHLTPATPMLIRGGNRYMEKTWSALCWENIGSKSPDLPGIRASVEKDGKAVWNGFDILHPNHNEAHMVNRPLAASGLTSYRCRGRYGWIMIGARDLDDALNEARRTDPDATSLDLQVWNGTAYQDVVPQTQESNSLNEMND